jgi:hypothetical protein
MTSARHIQMRAWLAALVGAVAPAVAFATIDLEPSWRPPTYERARDDVMSWRDQSNFADKIDEQLSDLWPEKSPDEADQRDLLERVVEGFAAAYPQARALVDACRADYAGPTPPDARWLAGSDFPAVVRNNLRLYYARWLAQYGLYDEVLAELEGLSPSDVADPASLLFYRMVAHHQLVQPDEARAALAQLLEQKERLPERFQQVAQLVERDLAALEDESLDHIARRMNDIRRRLEYGRAGEKVQAIEKGVVKSLDKKIDKLQQQQQQQCQPAAQGGGQMQPSRPMQDSRLPGLKAPMQVDQRDIGHQAGWGDLPPKERERALQQVGRDFPAHYRDLIEQYFRELASEPTSEDDSR